MADIFHLVSRAEHVAGCTNGKAEQGLGQLRQHVYGAQHLRAP